MKKNLFKFAGLFMAGLMVMQGIFAAGEQAKAAHSAAGKISHVNGVRVVVEDGSNKMSPCYCINRAALVAAGDTATSDMTLDANQAVLLNAAVLYGFNANGVTTGGITAEQKLLYDKTQDIVWAIIENRFDGTENTLSAMRNQGFDEGIMEKITALVTAPSYVNDTENEMTWNASTNQFELTLTNSKMVGSVSANASVQADTTTLPQGVQIVAEGENLKITSTEEFTTAKTVKIYKRAADKGQVIAWKTRGGNGQPQITLDHDEAPIAKVMDLKIKTGAKPVVATPAPEATVAPTPETEIPVQPEQNQEPVQENQTIQVGEKDVEEVPESELKEALDEVPKTADNSNIQLVVKLLGASAMALAALSIINGYDKKRRRI